MLADGIPRGIVEERCGQLMGDKVALDHRPTKVEHARPLVQKKAVRSLAATRLGVLSHRCRL